MWLKFNACMTLVSLFAAIVESAPSANSKVSADPSVPSKPSVNSTAPTTLASTIFKLPTDIDEDELLHETGLFMLGNMNLQVDPCEDFYEFACGNWMNTERVPASGRKDAFLHVIQTEINDLMVEFLKNSTGDTKTGEAKAKMFFSSCLTGGKDISVGVKTLLDNEKDVFGKLKLTGKDDWIIVNFMSPYNVYPLLPLSVNYSTSTRQFEVSINAPTAALANFPNSSKTDDLFKHFGSISNELKLMLEFERNLTSKVQTLNHTERLNLSEFLAKHEKDPIDWRRVFNQTFGDSISSEWFVNNKIANFTDLERFLRKSNVNNLRNYVKWRTVLKFYNIWKAEIHGDDKREQICRQHTETYFTYALIPWFIDYLYDSERREDTLKLAQSVLDSFLNMTEKYEWLDEDTRSHIASKLQAMDTFVGYKDEMRHRAVIDQVYSDVEITADWFKNLLTLEAHHAHVRLRSVNKTYLHPMLSPFNVNAYYADYINTAFITMGISQMPLYHTRFPASLKFGGLGMLIGHEMAHSVDSNGYHMDYDGKHYSWSSTSLRHFNERTRCLENQYNKFIYRGVQTNGSLTMPDNIADNAGARLAHHSYMECHGRQEGSEKPIPGMNFTNNELFFIKLAQTWCTGRDDAYKMHHIKNDAHAYAEFRVLGPLRNMREFADTFQCKLGSQMNPLKKCVVW